MSWRFPHFATSRPLSGRADAFVRGFSLVEVVLAVGITAFILISVFGLTTVAVKATMEADMMARVTSINRLTASLCQMEHFTNVTGSLPSTNYYDSWGTPTDPQYGYFRVDLSNVSPAGTSSNLVLLQMKVRWPVPQLTSSNVSIISLVNHE